MRLQFKILIGILLTIFTAPVIAQVGDLRNNFAVGVSGGVNINSVSFTPNVKQGSLMGMTGGITARYISEKYFAMICGLQVELNYSQHGWKEEYEDVTDTYSRTMDYIEIPFLAHLAFGKERGARFFLNLGPQIGFLLNESKKYEYEGEMFSPPYNVETEQHEKMADNKFDYGIVGGGGLELRTKAGNFLLEGRYYFALSDFYKNSKKDYFSRSAHSTIQAKITYLFDLSK